LVDHSFDPSEDDNLKRRIEEVAEALKEAKEEYDDAVAREENKLSKRPRMDLPSRQKSSYLTNGLGEPERHGTDLHALFIHQRMLGRGTQGEVHEVKEPTTGQCYARKQIYFRRDRSFSDEEEVLNEVKIMGKLHHPHIATVSFFVKESDAYSIIMQPVADSDLLGYLNRCIQLDFKPRLVKWIYSWFGSLVDALRYAHDCNVKHRDIKPANILIKDHRPYLSDFGIAKDFTGVDTSSTHEYFAQGTPVYRAPEAKASNARGRLADVFALGCVFSEMLTVNRGRSLEEFREFRQVEDSSSGPFAFRDNLEKVGEWLAKFETGDQLSNIIVEQIRDMLKEKPSARSSAEKVHDCLKRETAFFCRD
jgi:serine/threonine protein kinase